VGENNGAAIFVLGQDFVCPFDRRIPGLELQRDDDEFQAS